ncbi:OmpA family protein [Chryseolinea sp. H1M3-3]|jgi:outer membrane protein OmpA-like peptidoglycan-associated protein|uniref:OmpA family protein n=1 Tax=Chryseolinea sp. H1M3-3 TaxID=3034144 RepID=UPI0023EB8B22|nr:OmpA family protein [Chryseolinea sp. H1M3-3]
MVRQLLLSASILLLSLTVNAQHSQDEIRKSIFFGGGSYYVDEYQIEELYDWLDSIPNLLEKYDIHLISHTDPIGGKEYNEWLSKMRSEAVQHIILNRGDISERKISIKDWGLDNPVYNNKSYQGMQMNRRVDVILYPIIF